ncbi:MAG TPA: thioesterase family protein [Dermatophilaceae bacterium]|jgi:acyl-CoA thioesterase|nr:thioesterase family protein [Dermatophilaceae bacterium]
MTWARGMPVAPKIPTPADDLRRPAPPGRETPPRFGGVDFDSLPDLIPDDTAYYRRISADTFLPTLNTQGAWNAHEQHMAPVSGLLAHALTTHEPRPELALARITYEILGLIPAIPTTIEVRTIRPGRTIELIEATASTGGRPVVRATAWRLSRQDTTEVAGGEPSPLPSPDDCVPWRPSEIWPGGYIASIELRHTPDKQPGTGRAWIRTDKAVVADEEVAPIAAYLGLVDTANGMNVRVDPSEWLFPNIDLTVHLHRDPLGGPGHWVGFDTQVTFGREGVGLTSTTLHDESGAVGRAEQILTLRAGR